MSVTIANPTFNFLKQLKKNNNREWFNDHKDQYQSHRENVIDFAEELLTMMNQHDNIDTISGKKSLHRIYRDIRFSKDKTPYNCHWSGSFSRATNLLRGGYYWHIQPGNTIVAGGFWGPNKEDLKRFRDEIAIDAEPLRKILRKKSIVDTFGEIHGNRLKTAPRGFDKDHPDVDLLQLKQLILYKNFSDKDVLDSKFIKQVNETFKKMRPFMDYMSEVLTTNVNGESLYEL